MNRFKWTLLIGALFGFHASVMSQKKVLDHTVYDGWKRVAQPHILSDGSWMSYQIDPQEGDGKLVFRKVKDGTEFVIDRGYSARISKDGRWGYFLIKPLFKQTYLAKRAKQKDLPKDSIGWIDLKNGSIQKFPAAKSFKTGEKNRPYMAFLTDLNDTVRHEKVKENEGKNRKGRRSNGEGNKAHALIVVNPSSGRLDTIKYVKEYAFSSIGNRLVVVIEPEKKDSSLVSEVRLYDLPSMKSQTLSSEKAFYSLPTFNEAGNDLVFLASSDTVKTGNKHCSVYYHHDGNTSEIIPMSYQKNLPKDWCVNENSRPSFAKGGRRIWLGVAPFVAPEDTTLAEFEKPQVDIWHYADFQIQPQQKKRAEQERKKVYAAVIDLDHPTEIRPLTTSHWEQVVPMDEGNGRYALATDNTPYMIENQWTTRSVTDVSLIDLSDGSRIKVATALDARVQSSPDGRYLLWYNYSDSQWYSYNIAKATTVCLTKGCGVNFYDEESDTPSEPSPYDHRPVWMAGDEAVFISDRYDIWKFNPDGTSAQNLTKGFGRQHRWQMRHTDWVERSGSLARRDWSINEKETVGKGDKLWVTVFDEVTKKNGLGTVGVKAPMLPQIAMVDTFTYSSIVKAEDANVFVYQRGNFTTGNDLYVTSDFWKKQTRLTDINPQMKAYNWGTVRLVNWKAFDGTPLNGLLYVPENMDPTQKYPVMIYFYERNSETLYRPLSPSPSRSIVNIPFFCSRGYLVFVPDIVYKAGNPGECAYNCIVSGAEAICQQFPFADRSRMAIQGQSWGGYQTAYLVTRTNLFKAAGAGAPVSNMTSAYGGIRWSTGVYRSGQYEHGQSRIGKTLWEPGGLELYLKNSPLFAADKVETPLLIMHNDNDGAVPWYQGIEYYIALRRNGKKVWMIEYNNEEHNLNERRNMKDLSIRLQQFFDHYLLGAPMPVWMKSGVPAVDKGRDFGYELSK